MVSVITTYNKIIIIIISRGQGEMLDDLYVYELDGADGFTDVYLPSNSANCIH